MKTLVVGFTPDPRGEEALVLAKTLAGAGDTAILVCVVTPEVWGYPSLANVDQEYGRFLGEYATAAMAQARAALGDIPHLRFERVSARSATVGLTQLAEREQAHMVVLGSARSGSTIGRAALGGVSEEILHLASVPVAIAPSHYTGAARPSRITVAYSGGDAARSTVLHALGLAGALGVPLRLVSFAVRDRQMFPPLAGGGAEDVVVAGWVEQAQAGLDMVRGQIAVTGYPVHTEVSVGPDWDAAMAGLEWLDGELLLLGSSRLGPLQRVFLGSNAAKILRAAPVPVVVLPRQS